MDKMSNITRTQAAEARRGLLQMWRNYEQGV